jgi:hypothetical protein
MFVAPGEQQLAIRLIGASGADEAADPVIQFAGPLWLRVYWKPDGKTINKENQDKLRDWMRRHDFSTEPGDITMFLYNDAPQYQAARVQAAKELSVGGRTATIRHVPEDQLDHVIGTLRAEGADVSRAKESDGDGWVVVGTFP